MNIDALEVSLASRKPSRAGIRNCQASRLASATSSPRWDWRLPQHPLETEDERGEQSDREKGDERGGDRQHGHDPHEHQHVRAHADDRQQHRRRLRYAGRDVSVHLAQSACAVVRVRGEHIAAHQRGRDQRRDPRRLPEQPPAEEERQRALDDEQNSDRACYDGNQSGRIIRPHDVGDHRERAAVGADSREQLRQGDHRGDAEHVEEGEDDGCRDRRHRPHSGVRAGESQKLSQLSDRARIARCGRHLFSASDSVSRQRSGSGHTSSRDHRSLSSAASRGRPPAAHMSILLHGFHGGDRARYADSVLRSCSERGLSWGGQADILTSPSLNSKLSEGKS